jgi:tripartite-type tricarboxylate transporter receptor subunit TctC
MKFWQSSQWRLWFAQLLLLLCPLTATAQQAWPARPINLLVGFTPGGSVDIAARVIGEKLGVLLGETVVVDNKPGATGNIAAGLAAKAPRDGYTLYVATSVNAVSPYLYKSTSYDPLKDFAPITRWITTAYILIVSPSLPVKSVAELIQYAKANPGKLNYGSTGIGSPAHLAGEFLSNDAGISMVHVPFKGGPEVMASIRGGEVQLTFSPIPVALPMIRGGVVRALGISSAHRSELAPELPTIAEQGLPGFEVISWYGTVAPAGTPPAVIARLNKETTAVLQMSDVRARLAEQGMEPAPLGPDEFAKFFAAEVDKYGKIVAKAKITPM